MSVLLPTVQGESIRQSLIDYLTTTFALADADARDALDRFLADPAHGMFKGPYVRVRLPYRPADDGWAEALDWRPGIRPYGHQAAAFERLSSKEGRPKPTVVITGTGSGKTEAFLVPILDHVVRARRAGVAGTKALILYPMNALANDQAQRLTELLTSREDLAGVTAAIYTGEAASARRSRVSPDGLITDRDVIRDTAPDILLTNYKMLDQLLLRGADRRLWEQSATSLTYLVLDEFHTYDGAQGTDVAMLLRRLGLALKSYWRDDDPALTDDDRARPLGRATPVATSATLGSDDAPDEMLGFARTVFGERFEPDAVITESRMSVAEWVGDAPARLRVTAPGIAAVPIEQIDVAAVNKAVEALGHDPDTAELAAVVLEALYGGSADPASGVIRQAVTDRDSGLLLTLVTSHPLVERLVEGAATAVTLPDLAIAVAGPAAATVSATGTDGPWAQLMAHVIAMLGFVRSVAGRAAPSIDVHLWVRELTRIDRSAESTVRLAWSDDGPPTASDGEQARPAFPAVYCRHCGRSGWGVGLAPVGESLAVNDEHIRRNHAAHEGRFRALIHAASEAAAHDRGEQVEGLAWFSVRGRTILTSAPPDDDPDARDGWVLPVLATFDKDADRAARNDDCPSCGQSDGIRFLGAAVATLLSVSLSTLFGSARLGSDEKKALVFTDSVQDAAHRAGFVQARSHTLTFRAVVRDAVADGPLTLDALVDEMI